MQCRNCHFENMPGVDACGRCGGSLRLATAVIDVHPPRAGRWSKRMGKLVPRGLAFRARDAVLQAGVDISELPVGDFPERSVLLRMVVPGWPQLFLGQKVSGRALLFGYLLFLCLGMTFIGTGIGSFFLGLALVCHAASIIDVLTVATKDVRQRIAIGITCIAGVGFVIYYPAVRLVSRVAVPRVLLRDVPPFAAGDVVLYTPTESLWRGLQPGDVVLYEPPPTLNTAQQNRAVLLRGARIDRILAVGGQKIVWSGGKLQVDGSPSELAPLNPGQCSYQFETLVPPGHFLILPSSLDVTQTGTGGTQMHQISEIRESDVSGCVFFRNQPLARAGWIR
jgi:type IV secretory pathway protease TraF